MTQTHIHDDVCRATRVLADAGMLTPNDIAPRQRAAPRVRIAPCPCCGRGTAIEPGETPTECTGCRMSEVEAAAQIALDVEPEMFIDLNNTPNPNYQETDGMDLAEQLAEELKAAIVHNVANKPRTLQKQLGPSEIGEECQRKLAYKLLDWDPKPNTQIDPLPSFVGTAAHEAIAEALERMNADE